VWKVRRRYRATGSFAGYLFGIARMIWLASRRTARRSPQCVDAAQAEAGLWAPADDPARAPDACAARREAAEAILLALEHLPPEEQRMVFVMRTLDGLSLEDIAVALDCPVNTVRSRKILAIKKARHLLSSRSSQQVRTGSYRRRHHGLQTHAEKMRGVFGRRPVARSANGCRTAPGVLPGMPGDPGIPARFRHDMMRNAAFPIAHSAFKTPLRSNQGCRNPGGRFRCGWRRGGRVHSARGRWGGSGRPFRPGC